MKKYINLILIQAILSVISGVLIYKMSLIGRIGIHLWFRKYIIFRSWWKTALLLLLVQGIIIFVLALVRNIASKKGAQWTNYTMLLLGIIGCFATYLDFTMTSHKLMKNSFHSGFYLFWIGWFITCGWFIFTHQKHFSEKMEEITTNENINNINKQ
ncbi:MAG: DUF4499 domain-containing protein [Capnocytophaga sp.]|nr:DUF4499 domain-containing protein [Capnocytophaga sp.]